jgi:hypothetical protein
LRWRGNVIDGSTIRGIYEVNFGYNAKMGVYANSSSDIPELGEIVDKNIMQDTYNLGIR